LGKEEALLGAGGLFLSAVGSTILYAKQGKPRKCSFENVSLHENKAFISGIHLAV
jgi:hypothetical protein